MIHCEGEFPSCPNFGLEDELLAQPRARLMRAEDVRSRQGWIVRWDDGNVHDRLEESIVIAHPWCVPSPVDGIE